MARARHRPKHQSPLADAAAPRPSADQRFRKRERLGLRTDFDRVLGEKYSAGDDTLVVYVSPNDLPWSRLGIRVNKRVGTAVDRTYVRRRIREAFRTDKSQLPKGFDIVCIARAKAKDRSTDVAGALHRLILDAVRRSNRRKDAQR